MGRIFDAVLSHFNERQVRFSKVEGSDTAHLSFSGPNGTLHCKLAVEEDPGLVQFWVFLPLFAPEDRRLAVAEYITRANFGFRLGNFELDFNDGEIRFKTSAWPGSAPFVADHVEPLIGAATSTSNRYLPGLAKVIFANASPQQAIAEIECQNADVFGDMGRMLEDDTTGDFDPPTDTEQDLDDHGRNSDAA